MAFLSSVSTSLLGAWRRTTATLFGSSVLSTQSSSFRPTSLKLTGRSPLGMCHQVHLLETRKTLISEREQLFVSSHLRPRSYSTSPIPPRSPLFISTPLIPSDAKRSWSTSGTHTTSPWLCAVALLFTTGFLFTKSKAHANEHQTQPKLLSKEELHRLARALNIFTEGQEDAGLMKECFQRLLEDCLHGTGGVIQEHKDLAARVTDTSGRTLFLRMVEEGREPQIQQLISWGIDYRYCNSEGNNGLHLAAMNGYAELIPFLSDKFSINAVNKAGKTPLHLSIERGHSHIVRTLFRSGAKLDIPWKSPSGMVYSPLALAIQSGDVPTVDTVLKEDLRQLKAPITEVGTILHMAIRVRKNEECPVFKHLITKYYPHVKDLLYMPDPSGRIPFHLAAYEGVTSVVQFLVNSSEIPDKISVNYADKQGRTAVHWAVKGEQPNVIRQLYWLDADLCKSDFRGQGPIALVSLKKERSMALDDCRNLLEKLPVQGAAAKQLPPDFAKKPPYNLVFQGGGGKGIAYVGIIRGLESKGWLPDVRRLAGTSAGSITAALLAVGYSSQDLEKIMNKNFKDLLDPVDPMSKDLLEASEKKSKALAAWATLKEYVRMPGINPISKATALQNKLLETTGLCKGEALLQWISELIESATGKPDCTFKELHDLALENPKKFKDLYVYALCLKDNEAPKLVQFSHEDPVLQHVVIADAIRASASIPAVFKPHVLHCKFPNDEKIERPGLGRFVDGGLVKNYPIDAFDGNKYQNEPQDRGSKTNYRTLGFKFQVQGPTPNFDLDQAIGLGEAIVATFYDAEEILFAQAAEGDDRTVKIPIEKVGITEFNLEEGKKQRSIMSAEDAFSFFLQPQQETS